MIYYEIQDSAIGKILIPLHVIAKSYADCYWLKPADVEEMMTLDPSECVNWARNNMDWEEVKDHAIHIPPEEYKLDNLMKRVWVNPEKTTLIKP